MSTILDQGDSPMRPRDAGSTSLLMEPPRSVPKGPTAVLPAFDMALRSEPTSVRVARRVTKAWIRCHCRMTEDQVDAVVIVVSELCTNAVQHGRRESIDVRGWMSAPDELRIEVHDNSPSPVPAPCHAGTEQESGRGLVLVDVLVTELGGSWGFTEDGTCAWCCLALQGEAR
ncbi:ATP-binding protein [Streptomyces nodosus]|uniref:ATP-binding protein n=1 Tax=Streptomyces nodosus TaxID=40318 RepID=UPI00382DA3AF